MLKDGEGDVKDKIKMPSSSILENKGNSNRNEVDFEEEINKETVKTRILREEKMKMNSVLFDFSNIEQIDKAQMSVLESIKRVDGKVNVYIKHGEKVVLYGVTEEGCIEVNMKVLSAVLGCRIYKDGLLMTKNVIGRLTI